MDERRTNPLVTALAWLYLIFLAWYMMPPARRKLLAMRLARRLQQAARTVARAHGEYGMMRELRGDTDAAAQAYQTAYQLMIQVCDRAARWYDQARGTTL